MNGAVEFPTKIVGVSIEKNVKDDSLHYIYKLSNGVLIKYFPDKEK
jgi:hypothetical protein